MMSTVVSALQILASIFLVYCIVSQTAKQDAMSGLMAGTQKPEGAGQFKGKKGAEEKLAETTQKAAIAFLVISFIAAYFFG
jgi:protein translocase SecG subunit